MKRSHLAFWLILIFLAAFLLRLFIGNNQPFVSDELIIASRSIDIHTISAISTIDQMPLFHYLLDLTYSLFGITSFTTRFPSALFGSLMTIILFFIALFFFGETTALVSSLLLAISTYLISYQPESNTPMAFFILLASYLWIRGVEDKRVCLLVLAIIFTGIGTLLKPIALLSLPVFWIYALYCKVSLKTILSSSLAFLIFLIPLFVYNLILYQHTGFLDMLVVRYFQTQTYQPYQTLLEGGSFSFVKSGENIIALSSLFVRTDPLLVILFILGAYAIFLHKKKIILLWLLPFFFLLGSSAMAKHYISLVVFMILICSFGLSHFFSKKRLLLTALVFCIVFNLFMISDLFSPDPINLLRTEATTWKDNPVIVVDNRMYFGAATWIFNDYDLLTLSDFYKILNLSLQSPKSTLTEHSLIIVECSHPPCLLAEGGIANESREGISLIFDTIRAVLKEPFTIGDYTLYRTRIKLLSETRQTAQKSANFYDYNLRWRYKDPIGYYDGPQTPFEKKLWRLSLTIVYLALIILLLSVPFTLLLIPSFSACGDPLKFLWSPQELWPKLFVKRK